MDYICTWICTDEIGEESIYPQTGERSSSQKHQNIYWRCILLFYATSKRFNKKQKHILFSNTRTLPNLDGRSVEDSLKDLEVEIRFTDFNYKTPKGYFNLFQNQFYEFSILEYIAQHNPNQDDQYLILDSDCIFTQSVESLFRSAAPKGFTSFEDDCSTDLVIHGLSRKDMKLLYEDLLGKKIDIIPGYHLGEFFLASVKNINIIYNDFMVLWPKLMERHLKGQPKFNEEAQTLSFIYFKNNFQASKSKVILKRIWTNPVFYRNVETTDVNVAIWHLPAEKTYGLSELYNELIQNQPNYGQNVPHQKYMGVVKKLLGIPNLNLKGYFKYYVLSYFRAISKRAKKILLKN
ncbi:hypothetical protein [Pedobacter jejuensis]|uniref:Glycosyl transferase n=1 Tax=Pedobacter jejuensis TaxID=1268550 RepID=A0A3N0BUK8_9SPHI|nr:hypothetical protein [Pedobacter jejuensis]RNL53026.1 hypothetical protein D7004_10720 [Pedobacter jejuensis]